METTYFYSYFLCGNYIFLFIFLFIFFQDSANSNNKKSESINKQSTTNTESLIVKLDKNVTDIVSIDGGFAASTADKGNDETVIDDGIDHKQDPIELTAIIAQKDNEIMALKNEIVTLKTINLKIQKEKGKWIDKYQKLKQINTKTINELTEACTKLEAKNYKLTVGSFTEETTEMMEQYKIKIESLNEICTKPIHFEEHKHIAEQVSSENLQLRTENARLRSRINKKLKSAASKPNKPAPKPTNDVPKDEIDLWL